MKRKAVNVAIWVAALVAAAVLVDVMGARVVNFVIKMHGG